MLSKYRYNIYGDRRYVLAYGDVKIEMSGQEILDMVQHGHMPVNKHVFGSFDTPDISDTPVDLYTDTLDLSTEIH